MRHLPLRFCGGGLRCPYNLLKSMPSTENGRDTNKMYQINFDIILSSHDCVNGMIVEFFPFPTKQLTMKIKFSKY